MPSDIRPAGDEEDAAKNPAKTKPEVVAEPVEPSQAGPISKVENSPRSEKTDPPPPTPSLWDVWKNRKRRERSTWSDVVIMLATVVIAFYAIMQHVDLVDSGNQTNMLIGTATRVSNALNASAYQAGEALKKTIEISHVDQRAWIGVNSFGLVQFQEGQDIKLQIQLANSGRTPGLKMAQGSRWVTSPNLKIIQETDFFPLMAIPPDGRALITVTIAWKDIETRFSAIKDKTLVLSFNGVIRYHDIFGPQEPEHVTEYCLYLINPATREMAYCDRHNEMN